MGGVAGRSVGPGWAGAAAQPNADKSPHHKKAGCTGSFSSTRSPSQWFEQTVHQAVRAMIKPFSLAASSRIATNLDVGVWLPSPVLSSGTKGFTSG